MANREITIRAIDAVRAIRSGMDDVALMQEFNISAKGLQSLFNQLIAAGILSVPSWRRVVPFLRVCNCRRRIG